MQYFVQETSNKKKPKTFIQKEELSFEDESTSSKPLNELIKQWLMAINRLIKLKLKSELNMKQMGKSTTEGGGLRLILPLEINTKYKLPTILS